MIAWIRLVFLALAICFAAELPLIGRALGQEDVKISKEQLDELKRKAAAADRLQEQLNQAQKEIQTLKGSTPSNSIVVPIVRDSNNRIVPIPAAVFQSIPAQAPTPPLVELPVVTEGSVIHVNDLLTYFATDPAAATARFRHQTFSIRGYVTDFRKPVFLGIYDVNFRLPGQTLHVNCLFRPPEEFRSFYVSSNGEEMIGHTANARTVFARVGTELTIRGYCEGLKDGVVRLGGCQYLVTPKATR